MVNTQCIFECIYDFDVWLKQHHADIFKTIFDTKSTGFAYKFWMDKYNKTKLTHKFYLSISNPNKPLFICQFLIEHPEHTLEQVEDGLDILLWFCSSFYKYKLFELLDTDVNTNTSGESFDAQNFDFAEFIGSLNNTQQNILYKKYKEIQDLIQEKLIW